MTFEKWIKEADKDIGKAMKKGLQDHVLFRNNTHKNFLFPYYIQYKSFIIMKRLVLATWSLAIATIIINLILIIVRIKLS